MSPDTYLKTDGGTYYAVRILLDDGRFFLSHSAMAMPALYFKRSGAIQHRKDLKLAGFKHVQVVPVAWTLAYAAPNPQTANRKLKPET
jgi:hypothetical protein